MRHFDSSRFWGSCRTIASAILWFIWQAIRWPVLALLIVLEPVVRFVLSETKTKESDQYAAEHNDSPHPDPKRPFDGNLSSRIAVYAKRSQ
jgi:hypothetical protein